MEHGEMIAVDTPQRLFCYPPSVRVSAQLDVISWVSIDGLPNLPWSRDEHDHDPQKQIIKVGFHRAYWSVNESGSTALNNGLSELERSLARSELDVA